MCVGGSGDLKDTKFYRACFAEFLGTLLLVYVGCGSCGADWLSKYEPSMVQISLAFGLSVATIVWTIAGVSGGHNNPAVTVAMLTARRISIVRAAAYIVAQCLGAIAGAAILKGVTPAAVKSNLGATLFTDSFPLDRSQGFVVELIITFVLVTTVFATCDARRTDLHGSGPLAIGLSVTMCHLSAIKYTGSSMNPARSFGPAVVMNIWEQHWVYWAGPLVGGILACLTYELFFAADASKTKAKIFFTNRHYDPSDVTQVPIAKDTTAV